MTRTPHKHAELIKAWADGAEIEYFALEGSWLPTTRPEWSWNGKYRIKPEPKPDYTQLIYAKRKDPCGKLIYGDDVFLVTRDGETTKPIKVEICK